MEPQKSNNPSNTPTPGLNNNEGAVVIDHSPTASPEPQTIKPTTNVRPQQNTVNIGTTQPQNLQSVASTTLQKQTIQVPANSTPIEQLEPPAVAQLPTQPTILATTTPPELAIESVEADGEDNPQWQYHSGKLKTEYEDYDNSYKTDEAQKDSQNAGIIWSASEFVSHQKNTKWYVLLGIGAIVVSGILYLVTREIFSIVVVVILAIALGVFGAVKPKTLDYAIGDEGLQIGPKQFPYTTFHSFAVIDDAAIAYIQLLPQKRFMAPISIYFAPEDEKKIVDYLGGHLPLEHKKRDFTDKLASRIHF